MTINTFILLYLTIVIVSSLAVLPIYIILQKELYEFSEYTLYRYILLIFTVGFIGFPFYLIAAIFTYIICIILFFKEGKTFNQVIKEIYEN